MIIYFLMNSVSALTKFGLIWIIEENLAFLDIDLYYINIEVYPEIIL